MIRAEEVFEKWLEDHPHAADMCVLDIFLSAWKACEKDTDENLPESISPCLVRGDLGCLLVKGKCVGCGTLTYP